MSKVIVQELKDREWQDCDAEIIEEGSKPIKVIIKGLNPNKIRCIFPDKVAPKYKLNDTVKFAGFHSTIIDIRESVYGYEYLIHSPYILNDSWVNEKEPTLRYITSEGD